ncbi:MAG: MOP flippase family protein [Bacteroidales bacterium]
MSLKSQTISGVKWTTISTVNNSVVQMVKLLILARLLEKQDFGLIAIALMIIGLTDIFANLGLAVGLIHKQNITQKQYSSVFWLNLLISTVLFLGLWAVSPLFSNFYHEPMLNTIIPLLGLQLVISSFGKMFLTFKTKELEFKFISIVNIIGIEIAAIFTVILALNGFGVFSLVYGMLLQTTIIQAIYAISGIKKYRILFHFNLKEITDLLKIGGFQVGTQIVDYIASKLDIFLIGRFFGIELLGIYNLAKELILKVIQVINPIITNVATPAFAKIQQNVELMRTHYLQILKTLSSINFPIFITLFIFANSVTLVIYGEKMMEAAQFVRILSLWGLLLSVGNPAGILMVSLGRTDLGFYWTLVRASITLLAIFAASFFGLNAVAYAQVVIGFIFFFLYWKMMIYKMVQIPLKIYCKTNLKPLGFALLAAIPALPFLLFNQLSIQLLGVVLYFISYLVCNFLLNRKFITEMLHLVLNRNLSKN